MKVIINADDFGINQTVTSEIERMIELGAISSTTIMANGDCLDEVKRFAVLHPEISFGVHLCLSEFDSITKSHILHRYGITDENGRFVTKAIFRIDKFDEELKKAIQDELWAQIEIVKSLGIPLSHCDSHHHVHTIYALTEVFTNVLKMYGFTKVRRMSSFDTLRLRLHLCKWIKNIKLNNYYSKHFTTTDGFSSYNHFLKKPRPKGTIELMCHPGHSGEIYKAEMKLVENKSLQSRLDYKLISYNEL